MMSRPALAVSFELYRGPLTPGMRVVNTCSNPLCVAPLHLREVPALRVLPSPPITHPMKLTETDVRDIVADRANGMALKDIAEFYDVDISTVTGVLNGRVHSKITGIEKKPNGRAGRKPNLPKLEKEKYKHFHTRKIAFEFKTPGSKYTRTLWERVPDNTPDEALHDMAKVLAMPKEEYVIYVRRENSTLLRTLSSTDSFAGTAEVATL